MRRNLPSPPPAHPATAPAPAPPRSSGPARRTARSAGLAARSHAAQRATVARCPLANHSAAGRSPRTVSQRARAMTSRHVTSHGFTRPHRHAYTARDGLQRPRLGSSHGRPAVGAMFTWLLRCVCSTRDALPEAAALVDRLLRCVCSARDALPEAVASVGFTCPLPVGRSDASASLPTRF